MLGEGEKTLEEIVSKLIKNDNKKLNSIQLNEISGIAYNEVNQASNDFIVEKKILVIF